LIAASRPRLPARHRNGPLAIDLNVRLSMRTTQSASSSTRSALQFPLSFVGPRDIRCCLSFLHVSRLDTGTAHLQSISISGPPFRRAARFVAACAASLHVFRLDPWNGSIAGDLQHRLRSTTTALRLLVLIVLRLLRAPPAPLLLRLFCSPARWPPVQCFADRSAVDRSADDLE
jgi:hypothetical protein